MTKEQYIAKIKLLEIENQTLRARVEILEKAIREFGLAIGEEI
ncbi:MAG: hypothetical protein VX617_01065 [Pseudomonadota bacterium]|nr:hypothetical protein [Pseudomonadota bacterium]